MSKTAEHAWYRPRRYLHFDLPVSVESAERIALHPSRVARHAFYPFLSYEITSTKIVRDKSGSGLKKKQKVRPIAYAAHMDSHIYARYAHLLGELYEEKVKKLGIAGSVLAFRHLGKSNIDFASEAFQAITRFGDCCVVGLDITGFFDNIDHVELKRQWVNLLRARELPEDHYAIFRSLTRFATVKREAIYRVMNISVHNPKFGRRRICNPGEYRSLVRDGGLIQVNTNGKGIPQGSPLSALLSNIYMTEFDMRAQEFSSRHGGQYFRYCDDMLFIMPVSEEGACAKDEIERRVAKEIERVVKLNVNPDKTAVIEFSTKSGALSADKPLQYLGFMFDGQRVTLRSSSLARYSDRMKRGVSLAKRTRKKRNKQKAACGAPEKKELFKKKLYSRYSHLGKRNFIRYGLRAAKKMDSKTIKRQLKPLWRRLLEEIDK